MRTWVKMQGKVEGYNGIVDTKAQVEPLFAGRKATRMGCPDNPMKPTKFQLSSCVFPAILYVVALLFALYHQVISAIYDGIAFYCLWGMLYAVTGLNIKMKRVRVNFGFAARPDRDCHQLPANTEPVGGYIRSKTA